MEPSKMRESVGMRWKKPIEAILRREMRNTGRKRYTTFSVHVTTATRSEGLAVPNASLSHYSRIEPCTARQILTQSPVYNKPIEQDTLVRARL